MPIKMIRQPSETPNINNIDDFIPFRYAYGNQSGYIKNKGTELSYTVNGSDFIINSGRVVLQGVESDIDANGFTITIDPVEETRYYVVYYQVNLGSNTVNILSTYSTTAYPAISSGDDLTQITNGIANLVLYKFQAYNGVISNVQKVVQEIKYTKDVKVNNATNADNATNANNSTLVQNVNFNSSTPVTFGNYIIERKKLIMNTPVTLSINGTVGTEVTLYTDPNNISLYGRMFEIEIEAASAKQISKLTMGEYFFTPVFMFNDNTIMSLWLNRNLPTENYKMKGQLRSTSSKETIIYITRIWEIL